MGIKSFSPALLVMTVVVSTMGQGPVQVLQFYTEANCAGSSFISIYDTGNITDSYIKNISSVIVNGMWKYVACDNGFDCPIPPQMQPILARDTCLPFTTTNATAQIRVLRYGDTNQTSAKFYLYRAPYLQLDPIEVGQDGINIPVGISMQSFYFTGYHRWGTYSLPDFTGREDCFGPDFQVINTGYGFTYGQSLGGYTVRSVRYNICNGTGISTTLQPPTSTSTAPPTTSASTTTVTTTVPTTRTSASTTNSSSTTTASQPPVTGSTTESSTSSRIVFTCCPQGLFVWIMILNVFLNLWY